MEFEYAAFGSLQQLYLLPGYYCFGTERLYRLLAGAASAVLYINRCVERGSYILDSNNK
jgi:hypothetical protein